MDEFIQTLAQEGGEIALRAFTQRSFTQHCKGDNPNNVVTDTDVAVENHIIGRIHEKFPSHGIIAEESGKDSLDAEDVWVIDPIDGTLNFATGIPLFAVMVAHMHKGVIQESAICLPATDELFFASADSSSFCNGQKIARSSKADLGRSRGCMSTPASARSLTFLSHLNRSLSATPVQTNSYGSMGIHACYVASWRRDWVVSFTPHFHDLAATALLLERSGCAVTDVRGERIHAGSKGIVAAHPDCHISLLQVVQEVLRDRGE